MDKGANPCCGTEPRELTHIERMEVELKELKTKFYAGMGFLYSFKGDEVLSKKQKDLMSEQFVYMDGYIKALEKRISNDKGDDE